MYITNYIPSLIILVYKKILIRYFQKKRSCGHFYAIFLFLCFSANAFHTSVK